MTRNKLLLIGAIFVVAVVMLIVIFFPQKPKNSSPPNPEAPIPKYFSLTPAEMRGVVKATLAVPFKPVNNSQITGQTTFKEINGKVFVGVVLQNTPKGASYPAYITSGTCTQIGRPIYSLSPVVNGQTANYISKTMLEFEKDFPLSVKIYKSANDPRYYISCADLQQNAPQQDDQP